MLANQAKKVFKQQLYSCSVTSVVPGNELNLKIDKLKIYSLKKGGGEGKERKEGSFNSDQVPVLV